LAPNFGVLVAFRFLAGLGLGGAMPSFISLTSEYSPRTLRAVIVALLWAGFPLGGFVGGLLASWIIPAFGWQSVFWVGGVLPLFVCAALVAALPESIGYLVASGAPAQQIGSLLRRIFPADSIPADGAFVLNEEQARGVPVVQLFAMGRAASTILLWISYFIAFMMLVTHSAWAPILLKQEGIGTREAAFAMAAFNLGSVIATSFAGWLIARAGASIILPLAMVGSAMSMALVGYAAPSVGAVILLQALFGVFMGGGSSGLIALAAIYYPTAIRSTGVGWAMGMGRIGSFTGPLAVGSLVALGLSTAGIFVAIAVPALLAAATTAVVGRVKPA
jgi:MFS transporter, AAHS family, 4-hydroxybenzoate transporter